MSKLATAFPLYQLQITSPWLNLRLLTAEEVAHLALVSQGQILPPEGASWMGPWTQLPSPQYETQMLQYYMKNIAQWRRDNWLLNLGVFLQEEDLPIGSIGIQAENFSQQQTVKTGSWLLRDYQGQGYGREMRQAALFFVFQTLGAERARSGADPENTASRKISQALGYQEDGSEDWPDGTLKQRFLLRRQDWVAPEGITVSGFSACRDFFLGPEKYAHHSF